MNAFKRRYVVEVEMDTTSAPVGWGCAKHERQMLEEEIGAAFAMVVAKFYQTHWYGIARVTIKPEDSRPAKP